MGIVLFDADMDNDLDIYITSGGSENEANTQAYEDKFYINSGKGNFSIATAAIPKILLLNPAFGYRTMIKMATSICF